MANEPTKRDETIAKVFAATAGNDNKDKFYEDVVNYATADAATKARMDKLIATIDTKDLNTITVFAKEPTDALKKSSEDIVKRAQGATTFLGAFGSIKDKLANFDFNTVGKMAADYAKMVDRKLSMAAITFWNSPIKKIWYTITGVTGRNASMDKISHEIDKSLLQLGDVMADLESSKDKIPGVQTDLNTLEAARLASYSEYGLYLGAALEKLKRVQEELPKLEQEAGTSPLKQAEFRNAKIAMTVLNAKCTDMDSFHKTSLVQLKTIDDLQEALAMCSLKIDSHLTISQGQWTALLAEAATAVQIGNMAQTVAAADAFGDKIFEQTQTLADMTKALARSSFGHGTLDPVKVVAHLQKRTQDIKDDMAFIDQFNAKMVEQRAQLDEAGKQFRLAATKVYDPENTKQVADDAVKLLPAPSPAAKQPSL
jgi:hypothetical protein